MGAGIDSGSNGELPRLSRLVVVGASCSPSTLGTALRRGDVHSGIATATHTLRHAIARADSTCQCCAAAAMAATGSGVAAADSGATRRRTSSGSSLSRMDVETTVERVGEAVWGELQASPMHRVHMASGASISTEHAQLLADELLAHDGPDLFAVINAPRSGFPSLDAYTTAELLNLLRTWHDLNAQLQVAEAVVMQLVQRYCLADPLTYAHDVDVPAIRRTMEAWWSSHFGPESAYMANAARMAERYRQPLARDALAHYPCDLGDTQAHAVLRVALGVEQDLVLAATLGSVLRLEAALAAGLPWSSWVCDTAAEFGQLECLRYAHEHGCPWSSETCSRAAAFGHAECLRYAHEQGCPWDRTDCLMAAARGGHAACFQFASMPKCP
jgi:hypothetical protein